MKYWAKTKLPERVAISSGTTNFISIEPSKKRCFLHDHIRALPLVVTLLLSCSCNPLHTRQESTALTTLQRDYFLVRSINGPITGSAEYSNDGLDWQNLRVGTRLSPGMQIRTGENAKICLISGSPQIVIGILANSVVSFDRLNSFKAGGQPQMSTTCTLSKGTLVGYVKPVWPVVEHEVKCKKVTMCASVSAFESVSYAMTDGGDVTVHIGQVETVVEATTYKISAGEHFKASSRTVQKGISLKEHVMWENDVFGIYPK